jgi:hypothetical protein
MASACSRARALAAKGDSSALEVADLFCNEARLRIAEHFRNLFGPNDAALYKVSQRVMAGDLTWLEDGIVRAESVESSPADQKSRRETALV